MHDIHKEFVYKLLARGETIYNPLSETMLNHPCKCPDVYVKSRPFPSKDFICGTAWPRKDGTITINWDFVCYEDGFKEDELGLCDPILYYRNMDHLKAQTKPNDDTRSPSLEEQIVALEKQVTELESKLSEYRRIHFFDIDGLDLPNDYYENPIYEE